MDVCFASVLHVLFSSHSGKYQKHGGFLWVFFTKVRLTLTEHWNIFFPTKVCCVEYIRIYSYPWIYPQINAIMQCKLSNPLADTTELMPRSSLLVKETSMNVMLLEMRSSLVGSRSGADLSQNMGVWISRIKPSNCFRRLEKLVLPSIFNKSLSSLMMWNLQSYPTTVLNERMWHL